MYNRYWKNRGKWMTGENDFLQIPEERIWSDDVFCNRHICEKYWKYLTHRKKELDMVYKIYP